MGTSESSFFRVCICGSRHFDKPRIIRTFLDGLHFQYGDRLQVLSGMMKGADKIAADWAEPKELLVPFYANWNSHDADGTDVICRCSQSKPRCNAAGPRRNYKMVESGLNLVVGYMSHSAPPKKLVTGCGPLDASRGTLDMCKRADAAGIATWVTHSI